MNKNIIMASALLLASSNALAAGYFGVGVGTVDVDTDISDFDSTTGFEIYVGNNISKSLAIEAAYVDFGDAEDDIAPVWTISGTSLAFSALAKAQVSNNVDLFARIGMHMWDAELSEDGFGVFAEDDGTDILLGFGANAKLSNLNIGARYTLYDVDGDDITMFSVNAQVDF